jgi:hypothetical protein
MGRCGEHNGRSQPLSLAPELLKARGIEIPLIVMPGSIGEETAVQVLQSRAA